MENTGKPVLKWMWNIYCVKANLNHGALRLKLTDVTLSLWLDLRKKCLKF